MLTKVLRIHFILTKNGVALHNVSLLQIVIDSMAGVKCSLENRRGCLEIRISNAVRVLLSILYLTLAEPPRPVCTLKLSILVLEMV